MATAQSIAQQLASQYPTPATVPAIQRSQYLAQALQSLQESTDKGIKSPGQLWASLAASALLQSARAKSDRELLSGYTTAQHAQDNIANQGMGLPASPDQPAMAPPQPSMIDRGLGMVSHLLMGGSPHTAPAAASAAPMPTAAPAPGPGGPDLLSRIANMSDVGVHLPSLGPSPAAGGPPGGGAPPVGPAPAAPAAAPPGVPGMPSMAAMQNMLPGAHINSGYRSPEHNAEVGGVPNSWHTMGSPDAPGAFDLSPPGGMTLEQMAARIRGQAPDLRLINEGDHLHVQPMARNTGLMPVSNAGPVGVVQPPAPQMGAQPQAGPMAAPGGAPPAAAAPGPQPIPTGPMATPQEQALFRQYMANPATRQMGLDLAAKVAGRQAEPIGLNKDEYFDPKTNQVRSVHQMENVPSAPNAYVQRDPVDNSIKATANPAYGPVGAGQVMSGEGSISQVPTSQRPTFRIPGAPGFYVNGPDGTPQKVAEDNYTVKDAGAALQELTASPQYEKAAKLTNMYRGIVTASARPGGMTDAELKDNAAQIFSGGVARQFNAKMIDEGQGPILRLKQFGGEIMSGQKLSPEARQAIIKAANDYTTEAQKEFRGLAKSKSDFAAAHGQDISSFVGPLLQSIPDVPDISTIPNGSGGYDTSPHDTGGQRSPAALVAQARAAISQGAPKDKVIERLKAMGVDPGGL